MPIKITRNIEGLPKPGKLEEEDFIAPVGLRNEAGICKRCGRKSHGFFNCQRCRDMVNANRRKDDY
jgi:hypothetical protein